MKVPAEGPAQASTKVAAQMATETKEQKIEAEADGVYIDMGKDIEAKRHQV